MRFLETVSQVTSILVCLTMITFLGYMLGHQDTCPMPTTYAVVSPERLCTKQGGWWVPGLLKDEEDLCVTHEMLVKLGVKP